MHTYVDPRTGDPAPLISDALRALILEHEQRLNAAIVYAHVQHRCPCPNACTQTAAWRPSAPSLHSWQV